jgi:opacity protein-like surface antigen
MQRSALLFTLFFLVLVSGIASAQTDISANVTGVITKEVDGKGVQETATKSLGVLVSFRHFNGSHSGVEVNYGYTKNSQKYADQATGNLLASIQTSIHEVTGAYVFRLNRGMFQPYALAGAGLLMFSPTSSAIDAADPSISGQKRPTFLYGAGADVQVSKGMSVRAQYRGLICEAPDFFGNRVAIHTSRAMQTAAPSIGIVYKF